MKRIVLLIIAGIFCATSMGQVLTLDSCKYYALENNKKIKEAYLKCDASKQVKKNIYTNYFPKVNAGAMSMRSDKKFIETEIQEMNLPVYDGNLGNLSTATQFAYFPGMPLELLDYLNIGYITAVQPIFMGGRVRNGNKLALLGEEFFEYQLNLTKEEVLVSIEYYYWTILALEEKKKTLEEYRKFLNSLINDVSVSYESGLIQKSDLLKIQLELNSLNANKVKLDNSLSLLKMTLTQHMGIQYSEEFRIADTAIHIIAPKEFYKIPSEALLDRNEYQMLNKTVDVEKLQKKLSKGEYMPNFAIGVQGLYLDVVEQQNSYGIAFATLSIPLSDWWGGAHKIQEHKIQVKIAQNNLDEKTELMKLQIDKTFKNLIENYQQISLAKSSVEQTLEHLEVIKDNFDAGVVSTSDFLEAQAMYQKSRDALVDAKVTYRIKLADYLKATAQFYHQR